MHTFYAHLTQSIQQKAHQIGFNLVGIALPKILKDYHYYRKSINQSFHGKMAYLKRHLPLKKTPNQLLPQAQSIISCALNYYHPNQPSDFQEAHIAQYARNIDYHKVMTQMLKTLALFIHQKMPNVLTKVYCDTGPVLEKAYAQQAGLGWIGKNTCLLNPKIGSYFFLGEIITSLPLANSPTIPNYCGTCTKCIDICPTKALVAPYQLDSRRCIAYLTIELKDSIPLEFRPHIGNHLFGCDLCQQVCPWNRKAPISSIQEFVPQDNFKKQTLPQWLSLSEKDFSQTFQKSPIKRTKWLGFLRNTVVVAGNSKNHSLIPILKKLLKSSHPLLKNHIHWAITQIQKNHL